MEKDQGPTQTKESIEDNLRTSVGNPTKNNPDGTPQADASNVDAGGQVDLEALKSKIASQTTSDVASSKNVPDPATQQKVDQKQTDKQLAGKFETAEALEEGYVNLEKKIGQKSELEKIGQQLVQYSGRDTEQLSDDLKAAIVAQTGQATPDKTDNAQPNVDPEKLSQLETKVKAIEATALMQQLDREKAALFTKFPDAKNYESVLEDLWKKVDTKKSLEDIYVEKLKPTEDANVDKKIDESKTTFQAESSVGTAAPSKLGDIDTSKLTAAQLRQVLPRKAV